MLKQRSAKHQFRGLTMLDTKKISDYLQSENPTIRKEKDSVILLNEKYNTPNTSLLLFHFEPNLYESTNFRLKECSIKHDSVEGKDVYMFNDYFTENEGEVLRKYSREASFSRTSYASQESREKGETPARSMNNKEKWEFFAKPPQPIKEIYKLLGTFANRLNADISTLPWDICDQNICASAVATNKFERVSHESMEMGKHEDFNTEEGIPFGIPMLYKSEKTFFPGNFVNGAPGNPWLVSFMLYAAESNFTVPDYGIGTFFCNQDGTVAAKAECRHMSFVLFEGDIPHCTEESNIPSEINTWRVSYVFKLIINPKEPNRSMKKAFYELIKTYQNKR